MKRTDARLWNALFEAFTTPRAFAWLFDRVGFETDPVVVERELGDYEGECGARFTKSGAKLCAKTYTESAQYVLDRRPA